MMMNNLLTKIRNFDWTDYRVKSAYNKIWLADYFKPIEMNEIPTHWLQDFSRERLQDRFLLRADTVKSEIASHFITECQIAPFDFAGLLRIGGKTVGYGDSIEECVSKYINTHGKYSGHSPEELRTRVVDHLDSAIQRSITHLTSFAWEPGPQWDACDANHAAGIAATAVQQGIDPVVMDVKHHRTTTNPDIEQGQLFIVKTQGTILSALDKAADAGYPRYERDDFGVHQITLEAPTVSSDGLPYRCLLVDTSAKLSHMSMELLQKATSEGLAVDLIHELRKLEKMAPAEAERMYNGRKNGWGSELPTQIFNPRIPC